MLFPNRSECSLGGTRIQREENQRGKPASERIVKGEWDYARLEMRGAGEAWTYVTDAITEREARHWIGRSTQETQPRRTTTLPGRVVYM